MSEWVEGGRCFLWRFVKEDGSYDTSILLVNIPGTAGVDVAFLVINKSAPVHSPLRIRLVAVQLKNRQKGQLKSALLTLHPGTQYMTNKQREYAIQHCQRVNVTQSQRIAEDECMSRFPRSDSGGIDFSEWRDYHHELAIKHPLLCDKWIRIAVFAQPIHDDVYSFLLDFPGEICALHRRAKFETDGTGTGTAVSESKGGELDDQSDYSDEEEGGEEDPEIERLEAAADGSPVVVLTMNSKNWLTAKFRSDFVDCTNVKLSLPNLKNAVSYLDNLTVSAVREAQCTHK
jgi:hypothetical protein